GLPQKPVFLAGIVLQRLTWRTAGHGYDSGIARLDGGDSVELALGDNQRMVLQGFVPQAIHVPENLAAADILSETLAAAQRAVLAAHARLSVEVGNADGITAKLVRRADAKLHHQLDFEPAPR